MNQPASLSAPHERLRLRAADFELLHDGGAFANYGKTELIDGDIYIMSPQLTRHARVKSRLHFALTSRLRDIDSDLESIIEVSTQIADDSVPQPDILLTRYRGDRFVPGEMAVLVVEVADTTLRTDLGRKAELYAAAGVPEYWVIDINGGRVAMHAHPDAEGYQTQFDIPLGERLISATIEGLEIESDDLIG